jgi:demethylmenaquinone methyltransferase/2-methoxy-6-polyprenyl-1,4-benzoquinol methylase
MAITAIFISQGGKMSKRIERIFSRIYKNYDLINYVLSFGIDRIWRAKIVKMALRNVDNVKVLDAASGTGDLSIELFKFSKKYGKNVDISAIDINEDMLSVAKSKIKKRGFKINIKVDNALKTSYPSASFDVVVSAFGMRNFDDLDKFASEVMRLLKLNGNFVLADMSMQVKKYQKFLFKPYLLMIKFIGFFVDKEAYDWLVYSIQKFNFNKAEKIFELQGFKDVKIIPLTFGITSVIIGKKI